MGTVVKISDLKLGDTVSWYHYGGGVPPIVDGVVIGFAGGMGLRAPDAAVIAHANVYPSIPQNIIPIADDYTKYNYIVVRTNTVIDGVITEVIREIGEPWVMPGTVTRLTRKVLNLQIFDFDDSILPEIQRFLKNKGLTKVSMNVSGTE